MSLTLQQLKPGEACKVTSIGTKGLIKRRLMDMGVTPGVDIRLVKIAPLGDPIEINIRGYELSLRKEEANQIFVERL
ncbi:MAG TPA: FeoA family protein [Lachnospiraceae bacterium]|jgi:ferrous iron transport protein A|nr:FeoA family protein [Lachnospiraceae bacterium]HEX3076376.1 FeoA family protein [Lachnospiraceae bacterium]